MLFLCIIPPYYEDMTWWKRTWRIWYTRFNTLTDVQRVIGLFLFIVVLHIPSLQHVSLAAVNYDDGRDVLVASHILKDKEFPLRGPYAAGGFNILHNSPFYFYLIAFFYLASGYSVLGTYFLWVLVSALSVSLLYIVIVYIWHDRNIAFASAILASLHPLYFAISGIIAQPYIMPILTALMLVLIFKSEHTLSDVLCMIVVLSVGMHIHLSMVLLVPIISAWIGITSYRLYVASHKSIAVLAWPAVVACLSAGYWFALTFRQHVMDQTDAVFSGKFIGIHDVVRTFPQIIGVWIDLVVGISRHNTPAFIALVGSTIGLMFFLGITNPGKTRREHLYWLALLFIVPLYYSAFYQGVVVTGYFMVLLPVMIVVGAGVIHMISKMHVYAGVGAMLFIAYIFLRSTLPQIFPFAQAPILESMESVVQAIDIHQQVRAEKTGEDVVDDYWIAFISNEQGVLVDGWQTGTFWYLLEKKMHRSYVKVVDASTNFAVHNRHPKYLYLICDIRVLRLYSDDADCGYWVDQINQKYGVSNKLLRTNSPYMLYGTPFSPEAVKKFPQIF